MPNRWYMHVTGAADVALADKVWWSCPYRQGAADVALADKVCRPGPYRQGAADVALADKVAIDDTVRLYVGKPELVLRDRSLAV
jgi:hypothetical protein